MPAKSTPQLILEATSELLDQGGLDAVTMRSVAERANIGKSTIAHHFGSKQGLIDAVYLRAFWQIADQLTDQTPIDSIQAQRDEEKLRTFIDLHPGVGEIMRSWRCPPLGVEGEARFVSLFPHLPAAPHHSATLLVSTLAALREYGQLCPEAQSPRPFLASYRAFLGSLIERH